MDGPHAAKHSHFLFPSSDYAALLSSPVEIRSELLSSSEVVPGLLFFQHSSNPSFKNVSIKQLVSFSGYKKSGSLLQTKRRAERHSQTFTVHGQEGCCIWLQRYAMEQADQNAPNINTLTVRLPQTACMNPDREFTTWDEDGFMRIFCVHVTQKDKTSMRVPRPSPPLSKLTSLAPTSQSKPTSAAVVTAASRQLSLEDSKARAARARSSMSARTSPLSDDAVTPSAVKKQKRDVFPPPSGSTPIVADLLPSGSTVGNSSRRGFPDRELAILAPIDQFRSSFSAALPSASSMGWATSGSGGAKPIPSSILFPGWGGRSAEREIRMAMNNWNAVEPDHPTSAVMVKQEDADYNPVVMQSTEEDEVDTDNMGGGSLTVAPDDEADNGQLIEGNQNNVAVTRLPVCDMASAIELGLLFIETSIIHATDFVRIGKIRSGLPYLFLAGDTMRTVHQQAVAVRAKRPTISRLNWLNLRLLLSIGESNYHAPPPKMHSSAFRLYRYLMAELGRLVAGEDCTAAHTIENIPNGPVAAERSSNTVFGTIILAYSAVQSAAWPSLELMITGKHESHFQSTMTPEQYTSLAESRLGHLPPFAELWVSIFVAHKYLRDPRTLWKAEPLMRKCLDLTEHLEQSGAAQPPTSMQYTPQIVRTRVITKGLLCRLYYLYGQKDLCQEMATSIMKDVRRYEAATARASEGVQSSLCMDSALWQLVTYLPVVLCSMEFDNTPAVSIQQKQTVWRLASGVVTATEVQDDYNGLVLPFGVECVLRAMLAQIALRDGNRDLAFEICQSLVAASPVPFAGKTIESLCSLSICLSIIIEAIVLSTPSESLPCRQCGYTQPLPPREDDLSLNNQMRPQPPSRCAQCNTHRQPQTLLSPFEKVLAKFVVQAATTAMLFAAVPAGVANKAHLLAEAIRVMEEVEGMDINNGTHDTDHSAGAPLIFSSRQCDPSIYPEFHSGN